MPKKRYVYHVTSNPKGGWVVQKEGGKKPSAYADRKMDAVARGKELAKKVSLGQIIIHRQDGTIQNEHTYGDDL